MNKVRKAIEAAGGLTNVARLVGITPQSVNSWGNKGLPKTENNGQTDYVNVLLIEIERQNKYRKKQYKFTKQELLIESERLRG